MSITRLFSEEPTKGLSNWEFQFQYDPPALKAEREYALSYHCLCIIANLNKKGEGKADHA